MSVTIFCTFEQQDMADLAMGRLRNAVSGIKSIHYIGGRGSPSGILNANTQNAEPGSSTWADMTSVTPSRPVTVRIVCSNLSARAVKAKLVNMRAYQIITTA